MDRCKDRRLAARESGLGEPRRALTNHPVTIAALFIGARQSSGYGTKPRPEGVWRGRTR